MAVKPTILITGCSEGGIGYSLAVGFARENFHVFATARQLSSMTSLSNNPNITLLNLDVTSQESVQKAYKAVAKATGGTLDVIYHNAGVRSIVMGIHSDWELAEKTFKTNVFAVVEMTRVFMPLLLKAGPGSKVVLSNSVGALVPLPSTVLYSASKAALNMYAQVLDIELRPLGINVVNVITGEVGTTMAEQTMEKLPEDSPYKPIESIINKVWKTRTAVMPVGEYTEQVIKKVIQRTPPHRIWVGGNSTLVWLIETLGLQWVYGIMFNREYGLNQLVASKD